MIRRLERHLDALRISGMLTEEFRRMYRPEAAMVRPQKVIRVLKEAGVTFIVMGTHGVGSYRSEARATQDVDVLIAKKDHAKAVQAIRTAYPKLQAVDYRPMTRFIDPATRKGVIDLMKPVEPVYRMVFKNYVAIGNKYLIPTLELALISKFAAMTSSNRPVAKKYVDIGDFIDIVQHNQDVIDLAKLRRLGNKVYPDGGDEIIGLIEDIKAGRPLKI
jgi:hypothetical protein